jgi:hypothetical protein
MTATNAKTHLWPRDKLGAAIFALRSAPEWAKLDAQYSSGISVDPSTYVPEVLVPSFPPNIEECIEAWNTTFLINYFRMRAELCRIAAASRAANGGATTLPSEALPGLLAGAPAEAGPTAVFFCDDDDWFCPDLSDRLGEVNWSQPAIKVFPLLRLGAETFTFARRGAACAEVIGRRQDFHFRFQTNNYAIPANAELIPLLPELSDHIWGSDAADRHGLVDEYHDIIVSATNKTPCSASVIPQLLKDKSAFIRLVENYVGSLRQVQLSPGTEWCAGPIDASANLFESALG